MSKWSFILSCYFFGPSTIDTKYTHDVKFFHQDAGIRSGAHDPFRDGPTHKQRGSTTWKESCVFCSWMVVGKSQSCQAENLQRGFRGVHVFFVSGTFTIPKYLPDQGGVWWVKKRANFLQKRLRFNQNTFEHDGVHIKKKQETYLSA